MGHCCKHSVLGKRCWGPIKPANSNKRQIESRIFPEILQAISGSQAICSMNRSIVHLFGDTLLEVWVIGGIFYSCCLYKKCIWSRCTLCKHCHNQFSAKSYVMSGHCWGFGLELDEQHSQLTRPARPHRPLVCLAVNLGYSIIASVGE